MSVHETIDGAPSPSAADSRNSHPAASLQAVRVLCSCSGVGVFNRGIETFFREAFDGLRGLDGVESLMLKGAGQSLRDERVVWNLPRTGRLAPFLGKLAGRNGYVVEQWSTFLGVVRHIRRFRPHVVYYSDANLGMLLYRFRGQIGRSFQLLFSNGGPCHPPFVRTDFVHQVAPVYYDEAIAAGEPPSRQILVPYGINVPATPPSSHPEEKRKLRERLNLPIDRPIVLSVGWISATHKRMDYVIREMAALPAPRPFLQLLGAIDASSAPIIDLATKLLGPHGFAARSAPYAEVFDYYRAADCFVLASLNEGFGRVYLESLMHGLPTIAHRNAVTEYVLGQDGVLEDLSAPGNLARVMPFAIQTANNWQLAKRRWDGVCRRFSWEALRPQYREMFLRCASVLVEEHARG